MGYIDGCYRTPANIGHGQKALSDAYELTGMQSRRITFHNLRHSFATRVIEIGADMKAVVTFLGHSNAAITLNVYTDANPDSRRRTVNLIS